MKIILVFASALLLTGCADIERVQKLEARVDSLEKQLKGKNEAEAERQKNLENCVTVDAHDAYWDYVKLNGKPATNNPGAYSAPRYVWDLAQKQKDSKIEECKLLYGR
jgi:hypothetical protein